MVGVATFRHVGVQLGAITNGAFSLEVHQNTRLWLVVKDVPNEDVITHFPFITAGTYDLGDMEIPRYILYLADDGWKVRSGTSEDDSAFAILIRQEHSVPALRFPVDVKVFVQRDDIEDFSAEPLEVRAYAYGEKQKE